MKPAMLDTDVLSEFLRGNLRVLENVEQYLDEYEFININIITYYEIKNGLCIKMLENNWPNLKTLLP